MRIKCDVAQFDRSKANFHEHLKGHVEGILQIGGLVRILEACHEVITGICHLVFRRGRNDDPPGETQHDEEDEEHNAESIQL